MIPYAVLFKPSLIGSGGSHGLSFQRNRSKIFRFFPLRVADTKTICASIRLFSQHNQVASNGNIAAGNLILLCDFPYNLAGSTLCNRPQVNRLTFPTEHDLVAVDEDILIVYQRFRFVDLLLRRNLWMIGSNPPQSSQRRDSDVEKSIRLFRILFGALDQLQTLV